MSARAHLALAALAVTGALSGLLLMPLLLIALVAAAMIYALAQLVAAARVALRPAADHRTAEIIDIRELRHD